METIPCPGCRTELEPSATVCHICMRPRGKLEITRAYATLREMEKQRKKRPFIIAGRLLAAAAIGGVLYRFHGPILNAASRTSAYATKTMNDLLYPPPPRPAAAPPAASVETPPAPAHSSAFGSPSSPLRPAAPSKPAPPAAAPAAGTPAEKALTRAARVEDLPLPRFDPSTQWVFYGRVYDLVTLLPISGAQLSFPMPASGSNYSPMAPAPTYGMIVSSDSDGRFSVVLSRVADGQSYEIRSSGAGYAASVLYEPDIPYAKLPLSERREIVRNAQDGDMTLPPLTDVAGETSIRRDIFLAPSR